MKKGNHNDWLSAIRKSRLSLGVQKFNKAAEVFIWITKADTNSYLLIQNI